MDYIRHGLRLGVESQRDSVPQPRVGAQRLPWVSAFHFLQPQRGCGHHVAATPLGLGRASAVFPKVARSSQPWALCPNPVGILRSSHVCPSTRSRSDLLTVAVGFSPRIIERNRPRRVATLEHPALTSTSSLAPRGTLPWASDPWAEAHGYRHILAPRGHRGTSRSLFS
jgi:hypothetical protein